jgi:phosphatidylserine decarboxylase
VSLGQDRGALAVFVVEKEVLRMTWAILGSSLVLSLLTLLPLGAKAELPKRLAVPSSCVIGLLAGLTVRGIIGIATVSWPEVFLLELLCVGGLAVAFGLWRFYRDPERVPPGDGRGIVSPADGMVIYVKRVEKGSIAYSEKQGRTFSLTDFVGSDILPREGVLIGLSMNFFDVHVNRAPIDGRICLVHRIPGSFISLKKQEALIQNERALTVIDNGLFKVGVVQIASHLVRKIVPYVSEGSEIRRGDRIGMIRFGSQVDLFLPSVPGLQVVGRCGERVKAGMSIVARIVVGEQEAALKSRSGLPGRADTEECR